MKKPAFVPRRLSLLIAVSLFPAAVSANEPTTLTTVVVEGAPEVATPIGIDVANLPSLRSATSDTASLLRDVPGISLYGAGGISSLPTIHGLGDDRLRIKVDGMDLISACGNHMNPPLSYIDPSNVASIQVFSGIVPVSVSGDSIGGAILVKSAEPSFAAAGQGTLRKGEAGAFYRSNGDAYGGNFSATVASETLNVTYNGSTAQSGNYRSAKSFKAAGPAATDKPAHWLDGDEVGSSQYKSINHQLGFALKHDNHRVDLKLGLQDIPYQGFPNQRMDMTGNDSTQINLRYKGQYEWGVLEARAYEEKTRHKMQFGDDKQFWYGTAPGMPMDTEGRNSGVSVKGDILLSARDLLRVGGEIQQYRLNDWWPPSGSGGMSPNTFWNIRDGERDRLALFAEWDAQWNPAWLTQFGVRHETVDMNTGTVQGYNTTGAQYAAESAAFNASDRKKTDHNLDLTVLARYTPDAMRTFEFGYAQKARSPNLYERYAWSTGGMAMRMVNMAGDGNGYVGNLGLKPEVAHTLSATFDWHDAEQEKWGLKITPYYTHVDDYIDVRRCSSANSNCGAANQTATAGFVYLQFVNQSARLYGLDIAGYLPLAKTGDYGSFTATGLLSYINGENRTTGDNLYNIMPLNAKLALVQRVNNWTHTAEVQLVDAKENVSQVRNEVRTAGYGLLNLRSSYAWKQARIDIGIDNVLNRFYNLPLGGAYVGQGQTMSGTSVPWGVAVPGMGRSIYTGLTVKF